ncbi:MAG TPA: dUTP diphosphatase [Candidatus Thermoplasmatota archaeon]|nr:dUTP diphosphatase [Candidatus Thermoplasmatota archaeon]
MTSADLVVRVKRLTSAATLPAKAHPSDACWDLHASEAASIPRGGTVAVPTGLVLEVPEGWGAFVEPRSGLALKNGLDAFGGVIDAGYRGEVKVILHNAGAADFHVKPGDRIAQLALRAIPRVRFVEALELTASERGAGGFGSTGVGRPL